MDRSMLIGVLTAIAALFLVAGCAIKQNQTQNYKTSLAANAAGTEAIDVLLIAFDNGEGRAFRAVLPALKKQNLAIRVLTFGPADSLFEGNTNDVLSLSVALPGKEQSSLWRNDRNTILSQSDLKKILRYFNPAIVITGMTHTIQAQLIDSYRLNGSYVVAFYDNFENPENKSYVQPWLNSTTGVDELFLPAIYLEEYFSKLPQFRQAQLTVTGQPALNEWTKTFRETNRGALLQELKLDADRQVVVFAGGYDESYPQALERFLEAAKARSDLQFLITPHPRTDGSMEASAILRLKENGSDISHIHINRDHSTSQLSTVASLIVVHQSTTGFMARAQGLPVLYIASDDYSNPLLDSFQARKAWSWSGILNEMHRLLDQDHVLPPFHNMLVDKPVARFVDRIEELYWQFNKKPEQPVLESIEIQ